jgi:hypothetical protein
MTNDFDIFLPSAPLKLSASAGFSFRLWKFILDAARPFLRSVRQAATYQR